MAQYEIRTGEGFFASCDSLMVARALIALALSMGSRIAIAWDANGCRVKL